MATAIIHTHFCKNNDDDDVGNDGDDAASYSDQKLRILLQQWQSCQKFQLI